MTPLPSDTSLDVERVLYERLRDMPAWRKLEMVAEMNRAGRELVFNGLRRRYPRATPQELRRRLADALLGSELAERAYGSLVEPEQNDAA